MESDWLTYAKKLQAIASTGLHFATEEYDRERYQEVAEIANTMLARLGDVPVERIHDLIPQFAKGYATPQAEVRGALVKGNKILLVREKTDGLWTLPGGFADVGLTPAQNTAKEFWEESGLQVKATRLYAVKHKASNPYPADVRDFYKLFFLCEQTCENQPKPGHETTDAGFFPPDDLPPLSTSRVIREDIELAFRAARTPDLPVLFDQT